MKLGINTCSIERLMKKEMNAGNVESMIDPISHIEHSLKLGFRHFEITCDINFLFSDELNAHFINRLIALKKEHTLTYSVHLPFRGMELSYPCKEMSDAYAKLMVKVIKALELIQPEAYVIHAFGDLGKKFGKLGAESFMMKHMSGFSYYVLKKILDDSKIPSRKIAVENVKFPFIVLQSIIDELDLSICMDVGHILAGYSGEFTIKDFLNHNYDRIAEIHLHDAYKRSTPEGVMINDHIALGEGDLDYKWLISDLHERGYNKRIIMEMKYDAQISSFGLLTKEFPDLWL